MSAFIIPTPVEFRAFCEHAFEQISTDCCLFYSCCRDCGIDHLKEDEQAPVLFMFGSLKDLEHAGETGKLFFHFGLLEENGEIHATTNIGTALFTALQNQGFDVRWSGDPAERIAIMVDRLSYALFARDMQNKIDESNKEHARDIPKSAMDIPCPFPGLRIRVWNVENAAWAYDVAEANDDHSHERDVKSTQQDAITSALAVAQKIHLDVN